MDFQIAEMTAGDYEKVAELWRSTEGVGLDEDTDSREGIRKCNIFLFSKNETGEEFWKHVGWKERDDLKVFQKPTTCGHQVILDGVPVTPEHRSATTG